MYLGVIVHLCSFLRNTEKKRILTVENGEVNNNLVDENPNTIRYDTIRVVFDVIFITQIVKTSVYSLLLFYEVFFIRASLLQPDSPVYATLDYATIAALTVI